jgi:hypothetical protein
MVGGGGQALSPRLLGNECLRSIQGHGERASINGLGRPDSLSMIPTRHVFHDSVL